ncbi:MAG: Ig-like domain-containing protein [Sulfuricurvum sp.]
MKTLTLLRDTTRPSFRATTRNPAFKLISRLFAIFGLMMMFVISGWGSDQCSNTTDHIFTASGVDATYNNSYSNNKFDNGENRYYYFNVPSAGTLTFTHTSTASVQYKYHRTNCPSDSAGTSFNDGDTITFTGAEDFNMRIHASADNQQYDFTLVFSPTVTAIAVNDTINVVQNSTVSGNVLTNDTGPSISVTTWNNPSHGTLSAKNNATGAFTYTPTSGYSGLDSFTYEITDSGGHTSTATVNITVTAPLITDCPGTVISNLNGATATATDSASGTIGGNQTYYYNFTPAVAGTIQVDSYMSGSSNSLFIKNGCGSNLWSDTDDSDSKSSSEINVAAGQQIVIAYERRYSTSKSYTLDFTFTVGGSGGGGTEPNICNNGSTPVKDQDRDFCLRKSMTVAGNMVSTGNTLVVAPNSNNSSSGNSNANCSTYSNGAYIDIATNNNADYKLCTYSVNNSTTLAETMAQLVLPDPANSAIKYAALYVQSVVGSDTVNNVAVRIARNGGTYQTVTPAYIDYADFEGTYDSFSLMGDVTQIFTDNSWKDGNYTVSVSNLSEGDTGSTGMYGAWNLVIIYENIDEPMKSVSIFDGWKEVWSDDVPIPIAGFYTPKQTPINAKVATFVAEGDYTIGGDLFKAFRKSDNQWVDLKNTGQPASDPDQSSYSKVAIDGLRTPSPTNNNGIDIQNYDIGTGTTYNLLGTEQTDIDFKFTSTGDRYFPSMIAFSTDIYEPKLCYDYTLKQDGRYLSIDRTNNSARIETMVTTSPLEVLVYLRNKEADLSAEGISFTSDLNTTMFNVNQSANIQSSTPNGSGLINRGFSNSNPCPAYDKDTSHVTSNPGCTYDTTNYEYIRKDLGDLGSEEYIYTKFTIDPVGISGLADINESLSLYADYYITVGGTKFPYRYPLGNNKVPMCTPSSAYLPTWGLFNVVQHGQVQNNLKTQIARKPFDVDVIYDQVISTGVNDTPSSPVNTTVQVEMIDVDSFGDINASCANPDAGVSEPIIVPIAFTPNPAPAYQTLVTSQDSSYHNFALKNGAYRVWYFTETNGTLIQNWTATTDPNSKNKTVTGINGLFNSTSHGDCNASCAPNGSALSQTSGCFTCMKNNYGKPLCSRDNFSVRPEAFDIRIKDYDGAGVNTDLSHDVYGTTPDKNATTIPATLPRINLAAGYDYKYDINATGTEANVSGLTAVPRYTRYFNGPRSDYNITMMWDSPLTNAVCNDVAGRSLSFFIANGMRANQQEHLDQVGDYRLNMIDTSWTAVDQAAHIHTINNGFDAGTDCLVGYNDTGAGEPYGCDISSQHINGSLQYKDQNMNFKPAQFGLGFIYSLGKTVASTITAGGQGFVYMSDLNNTNDMNMSVRSTGQIRALGADGVLTTNFVGGCFAKDLNVTAIHDANLTYTTPFVARMINSTIANVQTYDSLETAQASNWIGTVDDTNFTKADNGALLNTIRFNFDRNQTTPHDPQTVTYSDINVTCALSADCNQSSVRNSTPNTAVGSSAMDFNVTHTYGRVIAKDQRVMGLIAFDGLARYEVYKTDHIFGTLLTVDPDYGDWYINILHNELTYGDASVTVVDPTTGSSLPNILTSTYGAGIETYKFNAFTVRQGYKAHIDTEGWLWNGIAADIYKDPVNPVTAVDDCDNHPCFNITFGRIIGNTGSAKTESENAKANKNSSSGTGWHSTSEYAPSVR